MHMKRMALARSNYTKNAIIDLYRQTTRVYSKYSICRRVILSFRAITHSKFPVIQHQQSPCVSVSLGGYVKLWMKWGRTYGLHIDCSLHNIGLLFTNLQLIQPL